MRIYKVLCEDSVTGMEMIASDLSFNQACVFLESQNLGKFLGCDGFGRVINIKFEKRFFSYDEERGYLLGE